MSVTSPAVVLSVAEAGDLARCEAVVARGLRTFVEVGRALVEIRNRRLYRAAHATFEEYAQARWGFDKAHIYRLMDGAEVHQLISSPMGDEINPAAPTSERQARPLARLLPHPAATAEEQASAEQEIRQAWKEAVETAPVAANGQPKVTARHVEETVARRINPVPTPQPSRRRPLTDALRDAAYTAVKTAESIRRLTEDDRWNRTAPKTDPLTRDNLRRAIQLLSAALDSLTEGTQ